MIIYCSTVDSSKVVGEVVCRANLADTGVRSWTAKDEGDFYSIEINSESRCVAVVYQVGDSVVALEVDDNCASKVIEPLIEKFGFDKVKWLSTK